MVVAQVVKVRSLPIQPMFLLCFTFHKICRQEQYLKNLSHHGVNLSLCGQGRGCFHQMYHQTQPLVGTATLPSLTPSSKPGDIFYKTSVDGQPLADESIQASWWKTIKSTTKVCVHRFAMQKFSIEEIAWKSYWQSAGSTWFWSNHRGSDSLKLRSPFWQCHVFLMPLRMLWLRFLGNPSPVVWRSPRPPKSSVLDDVSSRLSQEIACAVNDRLHLAMRRWATHWWQPGPSFDWSKSDPVGETRLVRFTEVKAVTGYSFDLPNGCRSGVLEIRMNVSVDSNLWNARSR